MTPQPYTLVWPAVSAEAPVLDAAQQAVVSRVEVAGHGPVLVLAGPGTGKTTTLVEAVAARVAAGAAPERILVLTFSRKAAQELRARLGARLGRATSAPLAWTFHAFCMQLLAASSALDPDAKGPLTLLPGAEQDVALRELVEGAIDDGRATWPAELSAAVRTRGFADELRRLLARSRTLGLDPDQLAALSDRPDWRSAAELFDEYLDVLDARGVIDYSELVLRAVRLAAGPDGEAVRAAYDVVLVDEYQDTDPAQEDLLRALAGEGRDLVVVGDPDQAIYAFRGADVRNILEFPRRFPRRDGSPAAVLALTTCRRSGPALLAASRAVVAPLPSVAGVDASVSRAHRRLAPSNPNCEAGDDLVEVLTFPHEAAEASAVADLLRREHLERGRSWSSMAVLVRSVAVSGPRLRRALASAGVPVEVATDELPLSEQAATASLLRALECAVDLARPVPSGVLDAERAHDLLVSPLGGFDAGTIRRLGRALRSDELAGGAGSARPSADLIRDALLDPRLLTTIDPTLADPARRVAGLLRRAADLVGAGAPAYEVLWAMWSATSWPQRLEQSARRGGAEGRRADQDLDAVLALFDVAARHDEQVGGRGVANLHRVLAAQQVPGETLAERSVRPGGVRLLTAHRSKGLEWDVVVVAGVQDELWPDLRRRGSLLDAERLGPDGLNPPLPASALLAEERRLFYVAVTRARRRLVVTAVASPLEDGLRPSRFLDDLGVDVVPVERPQQRPLALRPLVAELRRTAADEAVAPSLREAAVARLAVLADAQQDGRPLVPSADPGRWWGVLEPTASDVPFVSPGSAVRLSGSTLRDLGACPARWMLGHEVRAEGPRTSALGFGSVVHAIAEGVTNGVLPPDLDVLVARLDAVWDQLEFAAPWQRELERTAARDALSRFLAWDSKQRADGRTPLATEQKFELELEIPVMQTDAGPTVMKDVVLRGAIDRLDLDQEGRVVVVDYKTGRYTSTAATVAVDPQLGTYQLALERGALDDVLPPRADGTAPELGGAELVQLRHERKGGLPQVQPQPPLRAHAAGRAELDPAGDGRAWFDQLLVDATTRVVHEQLPAVPGPACSTCAFHASCPAQDAGGQVIT